MFESTSTPPPAPTKREQRARSLKKGALGGALSIFVAAWAVVATTHGAATSAEARSASGTFGQGSTNSGSSSETGDDHGSYDGGGRDSDFSNPWSIVKDAARSAAHNATDYSAPAVPRAVQTGQS